ncbi:hypothetical protein B0182_00125 [Moraxella bovis]|nr:hypothetical protein DQF64_01115 [Moraxella bovis]OOR92688.1 hypothetical protein B0182_00125 [Moraxella bovis]
MAYLLINLDKGKMPQCQPINTNQNRGNILTYLSALAVKFFKNPQKIYGFRACLPLVFTMKNKI